MAQILIIEPDLVLAQTYAQACEQAGHRVQICPAAQSAIQCADGIMPDVVVLELQLVGHSGIEFLYEFRSYSDWRDVPVVILSAVPAGEFIDSWQLLRDGLKVSAYHYKPHTSLRALLRSIDSVVSSQLQPA